MSEATSKIRRREFLNAAAAGAVLFAAAPVRGAPAKGKGTHDTPPVPGQASAQSGVYVCDVCGHVEFGPAPEFCPVCHTEERFSKKDSIFSEAMSKLKDGGAKHTPILRVQQKSTLLRDVPCREVHIRVGETLHEVEKANHIHFIDFYLDGAFFTRFFASPQMQPALVLFVKAAASKIRAVAFCNMHGFWQAEARL